MRTADAGRTNVRLALAALRASRALPIGAETHETDTSIRRLAEDFASHAAEREAWSAEYHRYLAVPPLDIGDLVRGTGTPRRTVGPAARLALPQALVDLAPSETLPPLKPAKWAQATTLAAWMIEQPEAFVAQLRTVDVAFAGRCAADPALRTRLTPAVRDALLTALVDASRDPDRDLRERIATAEALAPLGDPRYSTHRGPDGDALVPPMVALPGGSYPVGGGDGADPNTAPGHRVRLTPFAFGRFPVTRREWAAYLAEIYPDERHAAPRDWRDEPANGLRPVDGITWFEARAYCRWLADQTGRPFRLPTEVEWEAAAAGRDGRTYPPGEVVASECGNTVELHVRATTPIGLFPAGDTPDGIADMVGNVRAWTSTVWGPSPTGPPAYPYPYDASDGREADEAGQACRIVRGSSYLEPLAAARCTLRAVAERPSIRLNAIGLRLVEGSTG